MITVTVFLLGVLGGVVLKRNVDIQAGRRK